MSGTPEQQEPMQGSSSGAGDTDRTEQSSAEASGTTTLAATTASESQHRASAQLLATKVSSSRDRDSRDVEAGLGTLSGPIEAPKVIQPGEAYLIGRGGGGNLVESSANKGKANENNEEWKGWADILKERWFGK